MTPKRRERPPPRVEQGERYLVARLLPRALEFDQRRAVEPFLRQQAPRRKLAEHFWHAHPRAVLRASARRAAPAWPHARSRAPRECARRSRARFRACRSPAPSADGARTGDRAATRSTSTAEAMSGYCSLQASRSPARLTARCTWPSEAAAAGREVEFGEARAPVRRRARPACGGARRRRPSAAPAIAASSSRRRNRPAAPRGSSPSSARPSSSAP